MRTRGHLPNSPDIRAEFPGWKSPITGVVDRHGKLIATGDGFAGGPRVENAKNRLGGPSNHPRNPFALRLQGRSRTPHDIQANTYRKRRKGQANGNRKIAKLPVLTETVRMRTWNWELFKSLVKAKERTGVPLADQAMALGMEESTLRGYVEQRGRVPSKKMLELAPDYYQVELDDLWVWSGTKEGEAELRHARTILRDSLGAEEAAAYNDDQALSFYRHAKSALIFAKSNLPKPS